MEGERGDRRWPPLIRDHWCPIGSRHGRSSHRIGESTRMAPLIVVIALLGLVIGSFLNVVIHRVPAHESLVRPPSHCPACGHRIRNRHNIPVLGWLVLQRPVRRLSRAHQRAVSAGGNADRRVVRRRCAAVCGPATAGRAAGRAVLHGDGDQPGHDRSGRGPAAQLDRLPVLPGAGSVAGRCCPGSARRSCPATGRRRGRRAVPGLFHDGVPLSGRDGLRGRQTGRNRRWRTGFHLVSGAGGRCVRGVRHRLGRRDRKDCQPARHVRNAPSPSGRS